MPYHDYLITLRLLSPLGTPFQSDTLFGHLAWQVRFQDGEEGIQEFLKEFQGTTPPFILSDGFPGGLLPRPLLAIRGAVEEPQGALSCEDFALRKKKKHNKAPFLKREDFLKLIAGSEKDFDPTPQTSLWETLETPHAAIDRNFGTTGGEGSEGQFYMTEARVLRSETGEAWVDIYARVREDWLERLKTLFARLAQNGYGRDKSVGCGAFEMAAFEPFDGFRSVNGATGFVSLSTYMPAKDDPVDGHYFLRIKRGFLGEGVQANPYKRPLVQMEPGACFKTAGTPKPFYGRMVQGIADGNEKAVQCGLAFAVPCA